MIRSIKRLSTAYIVLVLVASLAMEIAKNVPPSFRASATLLVDHKYRNLKNEHEPETPIVSMEDETRTVAETIPRRDLMRQVILKHDLLSNQVFAGRNDHPKNLEILANQLAASLESRVVKGTRLVNVSLKYRDSELTPFLLNLIVTEYINQQYDLSLDSNRFARTLLTNETGLLKFKLKESETDLLNFRRTNHLIRPLADHRHQLVAQLDKLERQEQAKHNEIEFIEKQLNRIRSLGENALPSELRQVPGLIGTPELKRLEKRRSEQEWLITRLSSKRGADHPIIEAEHQLLKSIEELMDPLILAQATRVATQRDTLRQELSLIVERSNQTRASLESADELAPQYKALEREIQSRLALYDASLRRLKESNLTEGIEERVISIVEAANDVQDVTPSPFARFVKSLSIGVLLGFGPVIALTATWRFLNRVFKFSSPPQTKPAVSSSEKSE